MSEKLLKSFENKLIESFIAKDFEGIIESLFNIIKNSFSYQLILIKNVLKYENEIEVINEIIVYFLSNKFNSIKNSFNFSKRKDYIYFLRTIYLSIKHTIQDILAQNEEYLLKQRLRKDILTILKNSQYFDTFKKGSIIFVVKKKNINVEVNNIKFKSKNILGISINNIEKLIILIVENEPIMLNTLVNKCYHYLLKNGYIRLHIKEDYNDEKISYYKENFSIDKHQISDKIVKELIDNCTQTQLKIFYYYFIEELSLKEIAKKIKLSEQLVNYYKKRFLQILKKILLKYEISKDDLEIIELIFKKLKTELDKCPKD